MILSYSHSAKVVKEVTEVILFSFYFYATMFSIISRGREECSYKFLGRSCPQSSRLVPGHPIDVSLIQWEGSYTQAGTSSHIVSQYFSHFGFKPTNSSQSNWFACILVFFWEENQFPAEIVN